MLQHIHEDEIVFQRPRNMEPVADPEPKQALTQRLIETRLPQELSKSFVPAIMSVQGMHGRLNAVAISAFKKGAEFVNAPIFVPVLMV